MQVYLLTAKIVLANLLILSKLRRSIPPDDEAKVKRLKVEKLLLKSVRIQREKGLSKEGSS